MPSRRIVLGGGTASVAFARDIIRTALAADPALANRDHANLAAARRLRLRAPQYQPLTAGIVHFFGYGQSLSGGYLGCPVLSATQPYDNLMIGQATRALDNNIMPPSTTWVPTGPPNPDGTYPFNPMIATVELPNNPVKNGVLQSGGESPGEGAINFFRAAFLARLGVTAYPATRFVLTNCGLGGLTIAELSKGAVPNVYNRLLQAASYVQQSAASSGLTYQVGGMIWTHGEQNAGSSTPASSYLASLQQLQADFAADVVQGIGGAPPGTTVPWFSDQPDCSGLTLPGVIGTYQAIAEWATTPGSDFYLAGPVYQYPNWNVHLTANGYRWHSQQVAKAMIAVLLDNRTWLPLYVTGATLDANTITADLSVPVPPLLAGEALTGFTETTYPALGFQVYDSAGRIPLAGATIVGASTLRIRLSRPPQGSAYLQSGAQTRGDDIGANLCDSDPTIANSAYTYLPGVQQPQENITSWNGNPLVGQPYPLNNYLAVNQVPLMQG